MICEVLHDDGSPARAAVPRAVRRGAPHRDDLGRPDRRRTAPTLRRIAGAADARRSCVHARRRSDPCRGQAPRVLADLAERGRDRGAQAAGGVGREVGDEPEPAPPRSSSVRLTRGSPSSGRVGSSSSPTIHDTGGNSSSAGWSSRASSIDRRMRRTGPVARARLVALTVRDEREHQAGLAEVVRDHDRHAGAQPAGARSGSRR